MARASEAEDSRRKHHRSTSDEESLDRSKRHKHRRRHQDCKSMESGDGETEHIDEGENGKAGEMFKVIVSSANSKPAVYDMEEGEIIEDDVLSEIGAKKLGSGVESVEFDAVGTPRGVKFSDTVVKIGERNSDTSMNRKEHSRDVLPTQKNVVTGNVDYGRSYKGYKDDATEVDRGNLADPSLSYTHGNEPGEHNRGSHSPNCGPNGIHRRKRSSRSVDVSETKFHSRRIRYEEGSRKNHNHTDVYGDVKADHVSDDERTYLPSGDRRCDGRDLVGDEKRERRSTDRHRYSWGEDNNHDRGSWDTGREKIFGDGKEKDRRDRTIGEGRKREGSHGREREKKTEHDRKEDKARESSRGTAYDRVYEYRERERERGRNRVSDLEWVRRKDSSRSSYRDRNMDRDLDERDREKKRDSVIDGHSRTRDSRNDRYGDKYRGLESDNGRLSRYDYDDDRYVDQRRASDSRHIMCEPAYDRGNHRKHDAGKDHNAMEESLKECAVEVDRYFSILQNFQLFMS